MLRHKSLKSVLLLVLLVVSLSVRWMPVGAQDMTLPRPDLFLDVDWYRANLIATVDKWDGGLDGKSGMGAFGDNFDGFFHVNLDRQFNPVAMDSTTAVAQSRGVYMNVEAYRAAGPEEGRRFLDAAIKGADFLLSEMRDPRYGGFYWQVEESGHVVDFMKQGYIHYACHE